MYTIKEEREIEPETFAHLVSSTLYEKRFGPYFIEPVMAGLEKTPSGAYKPFIAATDLIGCLNFAKDFVVAGTASTKLYGVAEGLWEPDLEPEDLFETCAQTLLNAVDRDAYSGWGAEVHLMCVCFCVSDLGHGSVLTDCVQHQGQGDQAHAEGKDGLGSHCVCTSLASHFILVCIHRAC